MRTKTFRVVIAVVVSILLPTEVYGIKIARIARLTYTPGKIEYFQFIRGGVGADYHQGPEFHQSPNGDVMMHWYAYDYRELPTIGFYGSLDDALRLQSGRIVVAFMFMDPERSNAQTRVQHFALVCLFSDDGGRTWNRSGEITVDSPRGAMECQIVETEPDRLLCLFRTKAGYVYQSVSDDGGKSWSPSESTSLPSPESMVRMIRLQSGNLLVVWNNVSSMSQQPRHPLVAVLSKDGGRTWGEPRVIAEETGTNQLSNHGMVQLDDGRILLGISHYRDVRPMTSDLDLAILDEQALSE